MKKLLSPSSSLRLVPHLLLCAGLSTSLVAAWPQGGSGGGGLPPGSRGDECTHAVQTAAPPECQTGPLGCSIIHPVCTDPCDDASWTMGSCSGPANDCRTMSTSKDGEICNDCRCNDLFSGNGICVSTGNYTHGDDIVVIDC